MGQNDDRQNGFQVLINLWKIPRPLKSDISMQGPLELHKAQNVRCLNAIFWVLTLEDFTLRLFGS